MAAMEKVRGLFPLLSLVVIACVLISTTNNQQLPAGQQAFAQAAATDPYESYPKFVTEKGNLIIQPGKERNITFKSAGSLGRINVDGHDLSVTCDQVRTMKIRVDALQESFSQVRGSSFVTRLATLEGLVTSLQTNVSRAGTGSQLQTVTSNRLSSLEDVVAAVRSDLRSDSCQSNPCDNGGTCLPYFGGFHCLCREGWEGPRCANDKNECVDFQRTGLGCQNGAICRNEPGTYSCQCVNGFVGRHCSEKESHCSTSGHELCGMHGVCVDGQKLGSRFPYTCICDQGWYNTPDNPVCRDVDECNPSMAFGMPTQRPPCSQNPPVQCINTMGGFMCGPCQRGFTGNGFSCTDIDECLVNNGGCSTTPRVECINTFGSSTCGPCPPGFEGDGRRCIRSRSPCEVNNGGCHHLASCHENPAISASYVRCICPYGYTGVGIGPLGCALVPNPGSGAAGGMSPISGGTAVVSLSACNPNPCLNGGACVQQAPGGIPLCQCPMGFDGRLCEINIDDCWSSPCLNGATCVDGVGQYSCTCPRGFTGVNCDVEEWRCGGYLVADSGELEFPPPAGGDAYPHNVSCAWVIIVNNTKVVGYRFDRFDVEHSYSCDYDFLQLHDGPTASAHKIGTYCGANSPPLHDSLKSTHNSLYLWFRSDHSVAHSGFKLTWSAQEPQCGGYITGSHGAINSPGYPGRYPHDRDCYWFVSAPFGKRISFQFATMQLEVHPNCSYDYLKIYDGFSENSPEIGSYCNTTVPPPLETAGSFALLHFHSDNAASDVGFHITFSARTGIPGCGGVLADASGSFASPGHPDTYDNNIECDWVIRTHRDEKIRVHFETFALESSYSGCAYDYVEIREGERPDGPLVGRYCGLTKPSEYTSLGSSLFIKFHADHSISYTGFRAQYATICGGEYTSDSGLIKSPFHPDPYPHNKECVYVIALAPGKAITLDFLSFDIESHAHCGYDYLEIRDGDLSTSPIIGTFCGGPDQTPAPIISSANFLYMKFVTDGSVSNHGFMVNYTSVDVSCGGIYKDRQGSFASPGHPNEYPHGVTCNYIISAPPGSVVRLTFNDFHLETHLNCDYDYVEVHDVTRHQSLILGDNSTTTTSGDDGRTGHRLGKFCGSEVPPAITSMDNYLIVTFHADGSVAANGFSASYVVLNASSVCGGTYYGETGMIRSPGFPAGYPHSRDCTWTIIAPSGRQVYLNFVAFEMEAHENCNYDFLELRNGGSRFSPLIGRFCGTDLRGRKIPGHSNQMYLRMKTDAAEAGPGFFVTWNAAATGCGGTLTSAEGEIASPNYPMPFGHAGTCVYKIHVSKGSKIRVRFSDLDIDATSGSRVCAFNYLQLLNGPSIRSPEISKLCGSTTPEAFVTPDSYLTIVFRSRIPGEGRGFKLSYETACDGIVLERGLSGVLESPNFPRPYPHNRNCSWTIRAPRGNRLALAISHISIEDPHHTGQCQYDYLSFTEITTTSNGNTTREAGRWCGTNIPIPPTMSSRTDAVMVNFTSDYSLAYNGFRLEWRSIGPCGGVLRKPSGTITSPNYPRTYPYDTDCFWHIITEVGSAINLTVHNLDIEGSHSTERCTFDALRIYGGPDTSSPLLSEMCHQINSPRTVQSMGNEIYLVLQTDESVSGTGFYLTYETKEHGGCGAKIRNNMGTIHSPNYGSGTYDSALDCTWTITVDPNHVVNVNFTDFDVEPHVNCTYDYLAIYDGPDTGSPELAKFCGSSLPDGNPFQATGNEVTLRLVTDGSLAGRGFSASYSAGCGAKIIADDGGVLTSPNYPHFYPATSNCTWILRASRPTDRVTLTFTHMDINPGWRRAPDGPGGPGPNCTFHYVEVRDGENLVDSPSLGRFCFQRIPPPITTQGSSMIIHLHGRRWGFGVGFAASYSVADTACGGVMTSEEGTIASPGYPNNYPLLVECVWTLQASPGNRVTLSFQSFALTRSDHCNTDYVEVRKGSAVGELMTHSCGNALPTNLTASESLWIRFRSGNDSVAPGFVAHYALLHGNELSGLSGEVASPLYPHVYSRPGEYTWRITVPERHFVRVIFSDISIEKTHHRLSRSVCQSAIFFYDGLDDSAPTLGAWCGHAIPPVMVSTSNTIFVKFVSRVHFEGSRFKFSWEATDVSAPPKVEKCGGRISLNETGMAHITSPNYPQNYNDSQRCTWLISTVPHARIQLKVNNMDLESHRQCLYDSLKIYQESLISTARRTQFARLASLCKRSDVGVTYTARGRFMKLEFKSDYSRNDRGFNVTVSPTCGGLFLNKPLGTIKSIGYPTNGLSGPQECEYLIKVQAWKKIHVRFLSVNLGYSSTCTSTYISMRAGRSVDSPFWGNPKYCGQTIPANLPDATPSNFLLVRYVTSGAGNTQGFQMYFQQVPGGNCGGTFYLDDQDPSKEITSPNFPNGADRNTECEWRFIAPAGETVQIEIEDMNMVGQSGNRCQVEFLAVRDGSAAYNPRLGRFCGKVKPTTTIKTTSNGMFILYRNRVRRTTTSGSLGFRAVVKISECGGRLGGNTGLIASTHYPQAYPPGETCQWQVAGPAGHSLNFHFLDFRLPPSYNCSLATDKLRIYGSNDTGILGVDESFCGNGIGSVFEMPDNQASLTFTSGPQAGRFIENPRFRIRYNASIEECGGHLYGDSGEISSPRYPNPFPHPRACSWAIHAPIGRKVSITFTDFDVGFNRYRIGRTSCRTSYVMAFNGLYPPFNNRIALGPSGDARVVRYCGSSDPGVIRSNSSGLILVWVTNGVGNYRGFRATFTTTEPADCGGQLMGGTIGSITSPNFGNGGNYTNVTTCIWKYSADSSITSSSTSTPSSTIRLKVNAFDLEDPNYAGNCIFDFLEIRLDDGNGELWKTLCGNNVTGDIIVPFPNIWIRFQTDKLLTGKGFNVTYMPEPCGGIIEVDSTTVITSPEFPGLYAPNRDCVWLVKAEEGAQLNLTFTRLDVEGSSSSSTCDEDYVSIRNGGMDDSPEIGRYCSSTSNSERQVVTSNHVAWVQFHSNGDSRASAGFSLSIVPSNSGCGGIFHGTSGNITSPGSPGRYPASTECEWEIVARPGFHVNLAFVEKFDMEISTNCENDFVKVSYLHTNDTWIDVGRFCGKVMPTPDVTSYMTNRIKVTFRSNADVNGDGFKLSWNEGCGQTFNGSLSGEIFTPNYPSEYDNNLNCSWLINTKPDSVILLDFDPEFDIERGRKGCEFDNVTMYRTTTKSAAVANWVLDSGPICGDASRAPPFTRMMRGPALIRFVTDDSVVKKGFRANFTVEECGGSVTEQGEIHSPGHERYNLFDTNCTWSVEAPSGKIASLKFEKIYTTSAENCSIDYVAVYDGPSIDDSRLIGRYCGGDPFRLNVPGQAARSRSNLMTVQFFAHPDGYSRYQGGFQAIVSFTYGPDRGCGGRYNVTSAGVNFGSVDIDNDGKYEPDMDCVWYFSAIAPNKVLKIQFTGSFDVQALSADDGRPACLYDFVEVFDGSHLTEDSLGKFCGTSTPPALTSSSSWLAVRFVSDGDGANSGFRARVTLVDSPCGRVELPEASSTPRDLTLPSFPNTYQAGLRCSWIIEAPLRQKIRLALTSVDMEASQNCTKDRLEVIDMPPAAGEAGGLGGLTNVYDIPYHHTPRYTVTSDSVTAAVVWPLSHKSHTYCGRAHPRDFFSSSSRVRVKFQSDSTEQTGSGFKLSYRIAECSRNYTEPQGRLVSPNWPEGPPPSTKCEYSITAPSTTETISLYFTITVITGERTPNCTTSGFRVYDGANATAPLLANVCGWQTLTTLHSTTNKLFIVYETSSGALDPHTPGFDVVYTTTSQGRGCGGAPIMSNYAQIMSPFYAGGPAVSNPTTSPAVPSAGSNGTAVVHDCTWDIGVSSTYRANLHLLDFDLGSANCTENFLEIYAVDQHSQTANLQTRLCPEQAGEQISPMILPTNALRLHYVSTGAGRGWRVGVVASEIV